MLVKFLTKNATVYGKDREAMEKKISSRLSRYFTEDIEPEIAVKVTEEKRGFKVEITIPYLDYKLRAECSSQDGLFAAFDDSIDVIERRMTKLKGKLQRRKPEPEAVETIEPEEKYDVVRVKKYELKPMTIQEAILNMELLGHEFFVFLDVDTNQISTVYARKEGGFRGIYRSS